MLDLQPSGAIRLPSSMVRSHSHSTRRETLTWAIGSTTWSEWSSETAASSPRSPAVPISTANARMILRSGTSSGWTCLR